MFNRIDRKVRWATASVLLLTGVAACDTNKTSTPLPTERTTPTLSLVDKGLAEVAAGQATVIGLQKEIANDLGTRVALLDKNAGPGQGDNPTQEPRIVKAAETPTAVVISQEKEVKEPLFSISGVPDQVLPSDMQKTANEVVAAPGDVIHVNDLMLRTEHFFAEPGVRTLSMLGVVIDEDGKMKFDLIQIEKDLKDIRDGAAWELSPDTQRAFSHENYPFPVPEGASSLITGAGMHLEFENKDHSPAVINLEPMEGHSWAVYIKGFPRDYKKDTDPNAKVLATDINEGYVLGTILPPGQYGSLDQLKQTVSSAQGEFNAKNTISCGIDGCSGESVFALDLKSGGWTWINKANPEASFTLVDTNIKE